MTELKCTPYTRKNFASRDLGLMVHITDGDFSMVIPQTQFDQMTAAQLDEYFAHYKHVIPRP